AAVAARRGVASLAFTFSLTGGLPVTGGIAGLDAAVAAGLRRARQTFALGAARAPGAVRAAGLGSALAAARGLAWRATRAGATDLDIDTIDGGAVGRRAAPGTATAAAATAAPAPARGVLGRV